MSGIVLALAGGSFGPAPPPPIGSAFGGGFFAGQISTAGNGIADFNLVVAPKSTGESAGLRYKNANTATPGADSVINGAQNTADIVADGNSTVYPSAHFCNDLVTGGFSDWYLPATNELEICYYNLKPTTFNNVTSGGANTNAVPSRGSNYTTGVPAQTSAADFVVTTGTESFSGGSFGSSTETAAGTMSGQYFGTGGQYNSFPKTGFYKIRAVRKVAV